MDNCSEVGGARAITFRPDIEGLRAVAVGLVVALHAGVTAVSGGYVGVDVFFVVSGFLITSLLIREQRSTGRVSIPGFYARRARRILPAACLVIVVTVLVSYQQLGALLGRTNATDGVWSALFAADFRFISQGTDYFTSSLPPSTLQNYWSLAVEEQFYFVWPTVLFGLMLLGRRWNRSMLSLQLGLGVVVLASLALSIRQSVQEPTTAYFSPFTRAWELGAGALIAVGVTAITRLPVPVKAAATWVGLALIGVAAFTFDATTVFPGYAALVPVVGTMLVIAGGIGDPPGSARMLLALPPLRWIGLISFSLYLWHWPVLTIAEQRSPAALSAGVRVLCLLIILALSVATYLAVEHPLRTARALQARVGARTAWAQYRNVLVVGLVAIVLAVSVSVIVGDRANTVIEAAAHGTTASRSSADDLAGFDATQSELRKLDQVVRDGVAAGLAMRTVPADLDPPVLQIETAFIPKFQQCLQDREDVDVKPCAFGDPTSAETIVVFGDSHAMQWMSALDAYGRHAGYRVLAMYKAGCPVPEVTIWARSTAQPGGLELYPQCAEWRDHAFQRIRELAPAAVIISYYQAITNPGGESSARWLAGLRRSVTELQRSGAPVIQIGTTPTLTEDPGLCLARPGADPAGCVGGYWSPAKVSAELQLVRSMGGTAIDVAPWLCLNGRCPAVVGRWIAYANAGHLSSQYVRALAPLVADHLRSAGLR